MQKSKANNIGLSILPLFFDFNSCTNCGKCYYMCPSSIFEINKGEVIPTFYWDCTLCYICEAVCLSGAIKINPLAENMLKN